MGPWERAYDKIVYDSTSYEAAVGGLGEPWATLGNPLGLVPQRGQSDVTPPRTKNSTREIIIDQTILMLNS